MGTSLCWGINSLPLVQYMVFVPLLRSEPFSGGRCVDERNGFRCVCPSGFTGEKCEINENDCRVNPCMNGATCIDHVNEFKCRCVPGYQGTLCQENVNDCDGYTCANGGTCHDLQNDFICDCLPGFGGKDCREIISKCIEMPCQHGGDCQDLINDFKCTCRSGYHGKMCQYIEGQTPIPPHGKNATGAGSTTAATEKATNTGGEAGESKQEVRDQSVMGLQVTVYICVGVGVPCIIIIGILAFLLFRRHRKRHCDAQGSSNVQKENERNEIANMNNKAKTKCIDTDLIQQPTSSVSLKITNEEQQSSSRTLHINKNNLNIESNVSNKLYPKELNVSQNKDYRHLNTSRDSKEASSSHSSKILDCNKLVAQQHRSPHQTPFSTSVESPCSSTSENR